MKIMERRFKYFLIGIVSIVTFHSCKVGPGFKAQRNQIDSIAVYRYDSLQVAMTDSVLNISWWELFKEPVLDTLITIGLKENKDLLIASSRIEQARATLGFTKADLFPAFGYSGGAQRGNILNGQPTNSELEAVNLYSGFGTLNWEIDFWGKFRRANEAARAELVATEYGKRSVQIGLISQIASTYYLLLDYRWRLYISQQSLALRERSLTIIKARYDEGIVAEIELNQAQIQRAIAASAVPLYKRRVAQTENALSILLGLNPQSIITGNELYEQSFPPDIPVGIPSLLMERRPDVLQSEMLLHAQTARIGVAIAQRFPAIGITGLFGAASNELSALTLNPAAFAIGGTLAGPIFQFNKNKRRVELERKRTEQARYEYERTVINAFKEVEDALVEISTTKVELQARTDHVAAAQNAQKLSTERYDKGVTSYLEVIESQRQAFEAQLLLSEATQKLFNGYVNLYKALGGGWVSQQEEADFNNRNKN